ncbi:hypothetical protein JQN58_00160 [Aneurinibacillus sp. BA2021]|nr:hypothetical protein [Aneurinibacillus sp. BA2021]
MLDSTLPAPGLFTMNPFSGISPDTGGITARQDGTPGAAEQGADTARQAADLYTEQLRRQAYLTAFYMPYEEQPQLFNDLL